MGPAFFENAAQSSVCLLYTSLDLYMFEQVCKRLCHWQRTYGKTLKISVNLSGEMFNYRYYFKDYKRIHGQYPAPKECIEFELLESIVLNQVDRVREVTQELEEYGFSYSLDDFGSLSLIHISPSSHTKYIHYYSMFGTSSGFHK